MAHSAALQLGARLFPTSSQPHRHPVSPTLKLLHNVFERKRVDLPYKWPLLADGQDPSALEARLAFHLHRLNLTGEPLREALNGKAKLATALTQARASVNHGFIAELAAALNVAADELTRPLVTDETREWSFYRSSAQNRQLVWSNAARLASEQNLSLRDIADIIGLHVSDVAKALAGTSGKVLSLQHAEKLSAIHTPPSDPNALLPPASTPER